MAAYASSSPAAHPPPFAADAEDLEYVAVILAATPGSRLFPLTAGSGDSDDDDDDGGSGTGGGCLPKHLLPCSPLLLPAAAAKTTNAVSASPSDAPSPSPSNAAASPGLVPPLHRLLARCRGSGFRFVAVAIGSDDVATVPSLLGGGGGGGSRTAAPPCGFVGEGPGGTRTDMIFPAPTPAPKPRRGSVGGGARSAAREKDDAGMRVRVVRLPERCRGSADALRFLAAGYGPGGGSGGGVVGGEEGGDGDGSGTAPKGGKGGGQTTEEGGGGDVGAGGFLPPRSHAVVMAGDLFLEGELGLLAPVDVGGGADEGGGIGAGERRRRYDGGDVLSLLVDAHRHWNGGGACGNYEDDFGGDGDGGGAGGGAPRCACAMILTDVGAEDKDGIPLKESAKAKRGMLSREEEDMEYIGLSSETPPARRFGAGGRGRGGAPPMRRVVLKRSKIEVEEDEGIGATPKLIVPKARLHSSSSVRGRSTTLTVRTDLHDVHLYALSNWVFSSLLKSRPGMASLQKEVVPFLIAKQFRGAGGGAASKGKGKCGGDCDGAGGGKDDRDEPTSSSSSSPSPPPVPDAPFVVAAQVLSREASSLTLRACTIPSLLCAARETASAALRAKAAGGSGGAADAASPLPSFPEGSLAHTKWNTVLFPGCEVGEKVQTKSCIVGGRCSIGARARLNNVLLMDGAAVGEKSILQNSVVGPGATVGENCNLNDCTVGPGAVVPAGTRTAERGESFVA